MNNLALNLKLLKEKIALAAARSRGQKVELVAVTKTVPPPVIAEAIQLGITNFGENRVQEALPKVAAFPEVHWHFIGRLQTNKVRHVVGKFTLIHSLDRWKLAEALQKEALKQGHIVRALVQVNIGREEQKAGVDPSEVKDFLQDVSTLSQLHIEGLMTVPPICTNPEEVRPYFRQMYELFTSTKIKGVQMKYLSMGMSADYEVAVEEGANLVRVGSLLFGQRPN
ncbi:MAG: YggS family pyridoxal phosphate-dependent enzyme [Firmicutes bacterium]|nr:YggS family pyridoxal phosphate-dependent enzyme [Bacillota bacterium]